MRTTKSNKKRPAPELNLTSMIDVIFLLLIFFVFTSDFKEPEKLLPTNLSIPGAVASAEPIPQEERDLGQIFVRIASDADGVFWMVDGRRVDSLESVEETLAALSEIDSNVPVVVRPQRSIPIENVLDVYDAARRVGLAKIKFAASPESLSQ